jgi:hypothetical protein
MKHQWTRWTVHPEDGWMTVSQKDGVAVVVKEDVSGRWDASIAREVWGSGMTRDAAANQALSRYRESALGRR